MLKRVLLLTVQTQYKCRICRCYKQRPQSRMGYTGGFSTEKIEKNLHVNVLLVPRCVMVSATRLSITLYV